MAASLVVVFLLALSFYGHMKAVGFGMIIHTMRNLIPMYDIEKRKEMMGGP